MAEPIQTPESPTETASLQVAIQPVNASAGGSEPPGPVTVGMRKSRVQMKVSHLLVGLISLLWVLVFAATLVIVVASTREYLQRALESHAQDTATSLGLSITHSARTSDVVTIETMVNAIFDRGYYREIVVKSAGGKVLVTKQVEPAVEGVPPWFMSAVPLVAPRMDATVMDGWRQVAVVEVTSHTGYAYGELWRVSVRSAWVLLTVGILSLVVVLVVLRLALRPLDDMEAQAISIAKREFVTLKRLPWARELQRVAIALNSMCLSVEGMLREQSDLAERMRQKAYVDGVTSLMNRNDFTERLRHLLEANTKFPQGVLMLVRLRGFASYNEREGRQAGDAVLVQTAGILTSLCSRHGEALVARLDGPEFGVVVPNVTDAKVPELAEEFMRELQQVEELPRTDASLMPHLGAAYHRYHENASLGPLMAAANAALTVAQARGLPSWHVQEFQGEQKTSPLYVEMDGLFRLGVWRERIALQYQRVAACAADEQSWRYRSEACVRVLAADGSLVRASLFIATAKRLGALRLLDQIVIEKVIEHVRIHGPVNGGATAVNLSAESVTQPEFVDWLCAALTAAPTVAPHLVIEVAEHAVVNRIDAVKTAFERIRACGALLSIDRFGQSATSLGHLRSLLVDFVKIDGSSSGDVVGSTDRQFFVQALTGIAHGLSIQVIMEYVENQQQFDMARSLRVDGAQGYHVGRPE